MMQRELARLQVHNPGSPNGTDIGVFASPALLRRDLTAPPAPHPCKKRARLPELGEESLERGDVLVSTEEILQEQILALRETVLQLREIIRRQDVSPIPPAQCL